MNYLIIIRSFFSQEKMKKTTSNDFEIIRTLGEGAFSTVYLVKRKKDNKQYALKSILMEKLKKNYI